MVEKSDEFDEWRAIHQSFPSNSYEGYNQFIKVLLIKLSDMLDSSNFVRLFHCQSFALYCNQGVVTHIVPVEPFATGIKLFDH